MKTIKLFTLMSLVLLFAGSVSVYSQGVRGRVNQPLEYCTSLQGITEQQRNDLNALSAKHTAEMDALRNELWNSTDINTRNTIGVKMQDLRIAHYNKVQSYLTPAQKQEFLSVHPGFRGRGYGRGMGAGMYGAGPGRGYGRGPGRGYGGGRF